MSKNSGFFDDIKKDFKNIYKHGKKAVNGFSSGHRHEHDDDCGNCCSGYGGRRPRCFGGPPFLNLEDHLGFIYYYVPKCV